MPELPEVEVTRLGITNYLKNNKITNVIIRQNQLRYLINDEINNAVNQPVLEIERRGKYLILRLEFGNILIHLGMSGVLSIVDKNTPIQKHDHIDFAINNGVILRYNDPRRFGAILWVENDPYEHKLLKNLGVEPLTNHFTASYIFEKSQTKKTKIKQFIMDNKVVVGVGNIYACEALFKTKINPLISAKDIHFKQYEELVKNIKEILTYSISQGGTTFRDFKHADGSKGHFKQNLLVYGRAGKPCFTCSGEIKSINIGQRNTFYCPNCQKL